MNTLTFNNIALQPVANNDGQIWLTSSELAKALDYADVRSITRIFNRNKDEFSDTMTEVVKLTTSSKTKGLVTKTRIFSLRGCHLIAMFARTNIAKEFRKWVLDILDRETRTTSKQREALISACDKLAIGNTLRSDVYTQVANHFGYEKVTQIPAPLLPEAVAFVYESLLARHGGSDIDLKYHSDMHRLGRYKVDEIKHAIGVAKKAYYSLQSATESLDCALEVIDTHNDTNRSVFESLIQTTP